MCGILGVVGEDRAEVEAAARKGLAALEHRGPDDWGLTVQPFGNGFLALAHARLSILDLSTGGRQPMFRGPVPEGGRGSAVPGGDGKALIFNGEIYNFRALRSQLEGGTPAQPFRTGGDTEVLLHGLAREGADFLAELRGMFSFAFADVRERRLLLARDRLGIKPLYYAALSRGVVFGSEVRALLATGLVKRRLDAVGLGRLLSYGAAQDPDTLVLGLRSLPAGHLLDIRDGFVGQPKRWWSLPTAVDRTPTRAEWVHEVRRTLEEAVALHLVSDVPVGAFLSGGVDSSSVVSLIARAQSEPVRTCTVVSRGEEVDSESPLASEVATRYGTHHAVEELSPEDASVRTRRSSDALDLPSVDGANTYVVSEAIRRQGCTVALSGLGGDELFLGYDFFPKLSRWAALRYLPGLNGLGATLRRMAPAGSHVLHRAASLASTGGDVEKLLRQQRLLLAPGQRDAVLRYEWRVPDLYALTSPLDPSEVQHDDVLNMASAFELRGYCQNMLLRDSDAMSMAHGLELRVPMLDHLLVELLLRIPGEMKLPSGGTNKPLLVDAMRDLLPEGVYRRRKRGFGLAIKLWMRTSMRAEIEQTLLREHPVFDADGLRGLWTRFLSGDDHLAPRLWGLYRVMRWVDRHLLES